jgi:hypothetical protein
MSTAEERRDRMAAHLRDLNDVLLRTPLAGRTWMFGGLLLGWVREGGLMLHDTSDADFALLADDADRLEASFEALAEAGFKHIHRFPGIAGEATEHSFHRADAKFDFFLLHLRSDRFAYCNYGHGPGGPVKNRCEIPAQPLEEIRFLGRTWLKVADHDAELTALYGDWRTPNPSWNYMHGPAIVAREPWDDSTYDLTRRVLAC